ncbi:riboflavin kinase / FMN adenylyltransferase [Hathewaya proteolytica DSM 3090]|uniref:Riboflavin biosynthesis protein n=1 Tax=Hathewaya proteolytica DSM 3090 TaxID=1121331 RepID=A0A1M6J525_9CLOT|nr:bifunctional riboflavin kinase/FAD synthetase [Hathewaya proteolytica]SHJ41834.1 riboflavin kinase / FMN adenylyltransferase [Hathewaya proteolytica DSM 3090]
MILLDDKCTELKHKTFIALGSFDGLHLGHLELIKKTVSLAKENNCYSMVYTFDNHPMTVINAEKAPKLIQSNEDKISLLKAEGVDYVKFEKFDFKCMNTECDDFVCALADKYNANGIVVGFNYRFGKGNRGDIELLSKLCSTYNLKLHICPPFIIDKNIVSSTFIRNLILNGQVSSVKKYLGRYFSIEDTVIHGKEIGRVLGFPTANLILDSRFITPKRGVYFTIVQFNNIFYKAITNVGYNPTVSGTKLSIESHILDFNENIYGCKIKVYFLEWLRDEMKFGSLEELKNRLSLDKESVYKKQNIL